jgi:hypothetical protein
MVDVPFELQIQSKLVIMIFAIAAFGLFAVESFIDCLEDVVPILDSPYIDLLLVIISLVILILFFLAFIKRR